MVQKKGPIATRGSLELSGRIAIVGRVCPSELADILDNTGVEDILNELDLASEVACLAFKPVAEVEFIVTVVAAAPSRVPTELEEKFVVVLSNEVGMATGQNDHTLLS